MKEIARIIIIVTLVFLAAYIGAIFKEIEMAYTAKKVLEEMKKGNYEREK